MGQVMTSCREWTGATNGQGYGQRTINQRRVYVHRLAWEAAHGPIPVGMSVLHRCDNPPCYEVSHLFLGTQADNIRDAKAKGRLSRHPEALRGEACPTHKLSRENVMAIRRRHAEGESARALGREYGVSKTTITMAARGLSWAHVP